MTTFLLVSGFLFWVIIIAGIILFSTGILSCNVQDTNKDDNIKL